MTHEELFLDNGAEFFGNRLIYRGKDVGVKVPGSSLVLTPEGEEVHAQLADITDVVAKPKAGGKGVAKKQQKSDAAPKISAETGSDSVDALLGSLDD